MPAVAAPAAVADSHDTTLDMKGAVASAAAADTDPAHSLAAAAHRNLLLHCFLGIADLDSKTWSSKSPGCFPGSLNVKQRPLDLVTVTRYKIRDEV